MEKLELNDEIEYSGRKATVISSNIPENVKIKTFWITGYEEVKFNYQTILFVDDCGEVSQVPYNSEKLFLQYKTGNKNYNWELKKAVEIWKDGVLIRRIVKPIKPINYKVCREPEVMFEAPKSRCTVCGTTCYVGIFTVECPNGCCNN